MRKRMPEEVHRLISRSDSPSKRIYEAVKLIPYGQVATYAQIAEMAGDRKMARAVGNALHRNPDPDNIPCYRVVNSKGELAGKFAFGGAAKQGEMLMAEGIEVVDGRVDLDKYQMRRKPAVIDGMASFFFVILCGLILTGCSAGKQDQASGTGVYFDTVVDIRIYDDNAEELLKGCFDICEKMEKTLSAHDEESELYKLDHRSSRSVEVSDDLAECISEGLYYSEVSEGAFDITVLPLKDLWDFGSDDPSVPAKEDIDAALKKVDFRRVHVSGNTISFDDPGTRIDLGGIAKGYISAKLREYLKDNGCTSALINLGGNVSALGKKPDGSKWVVGIQEPFADRGTVYDTLDIDDKCVVSSGTYERYFTEDGKEYHHILDTKTGYPADTGVQQASVTGKDDILCDALSTICVILGKEEADSLIKKEGWDVHVIYITDEEHPR